LPDEEDGEEPSPLQLQHLEELLVISSNSADVLDACEEDEAKEVALRATAHLSRMTSTSF